MFRLIASNSQGGLRPALLRKVRSNTSTLKLPGANVDLDLNPIQFRTNATSAQAAPASSATPLGKVDRYFSKTSVDPLLKDAMSSTGSSAKLNRFEELLVTANQVNPKNSNQSHKQYFETINYLFTMFRDDAVKDNVTRRNIFQYANLLNNSVYQNRTSRLSGSRNRDSDQYQSNTLNNDVMLKTAILDLAENIANGQFKNILDSNTLRVLLLAMFQFKVYPEMISLWESGVNDETVSKVYLSQNILSVILPVAFDENRFTYEQILQIYELNTKDASNVNFELVGTIGKIAIKAGDYSRGLDSLESLLQIYESNGKANKRMILRSLSELHLSFIGSCKDIRIAKHFFDKVVDGDLPYQVLLKAPHVQSLFENCVEVNESFDSILYFWKVTVEHYTGENNDKTNLNSRYAILNNSFFSIFFKLFPSLTEESYIKLKEVIAIYANIKPVDEFFLNTVISNYSWNDKVVFEQLVENYSIHNVSRTPVSYRVCLKKIGDIKEYSESEILNQWNESLAHLDSNGYKYIPIADWAALRDATILSSHRAEREEFYLKVLDAYKNYHQDERACLRFVKYWLNRDDQVKKVAIVSLQEHPEFNCSLDIEVPQFKNLRENVNYKKVTAPMFKQR
ncbi:hypothetical protein FOB63_002062 [Clavispora lusitaniae]|uniref:Protein RMD9, mitochondrial n=1 Tax=Clavispora lusitaniae (strain ATCC 42720) TaxID=306902 RepID=C4XZB5_CLAL4|nr:uncharacterized protein CLUG_01297 [Clavispora lusitaniae ATCC 42720]EEQ37174.1 hypothetical protein CLUG_01297 [Clavispora lusitaniae ATCC 42720]KAF5212424.1 Protein rmd9, mitochondrial [Clavispora lusitaniae]KAF7583844.1 hypothetical protein FOB63_002062 [Clavispora lusitaniae]